MKSLFVVYMGQQSASPPAWVAWIEIMNALRYSGVAAKSPPAWVAWIEILEAGESFGRLHVATRMGGVD